MRARFCFTVTNQMHSDGRFLLGMNFQKSKSSSIAIVYFQKSGCKGNHQPPIDNCHTTTHSPCLHGPNQLSDNNIQNEITAKIVVWCDYFAVVLYMVVKKGNYLKTQKKKSCKSCDLQDSVRRERDSNPRYLSVRRFSRPVHSTTLPSLLTWRTCLVS